MNRDGQNSANDTSDDDLDDDLREFEEWSNRQDDERNSSALNE